MAGVLTFAETREGQLKKGAHEIVAAARALADGLGGEVHAALLGGSGVESFAAELGTAGADAVLVGESEALARYSPEGYTTILVRAIREGGYQAVIFPASALGRDLAPRVAARLGVGYAGECTAVAGQGNAVTVTRPEYAGKITSQLSFAASPAVLSLRSGAVTTPETARPGAVRALDVSLGGADFGAVVREIRAAATAAKLDVTEAPVIVSGGRGLRGPEHFQLLEELAAAFGGRAAVGASRAVVDAGWRPHAEQVGQTGKTVAPQLYFAIGISGAIQHLAGMRTAKVIVAINKDPDAAIFKVADYGIVGDLFEIVPRLTEEIRKLH